MTDVKDTTAKDTPTADATEAEIEKEPEEVQEEEETVGQYAAPIVDTSTPVVHDAPFAVTDRQLRRANKMQGLFFAMMIALVLDGILTLAILPIVGLSSYLMFLVIFAIILVFSIFVTAVALADSSKIRNVNVKATQKWVSTKYGLDLSNGQAHTLNRNEVSIGSTKGWDKLELGGYPLGVQITWSPKHGYRLVTSNGEADIELPNARVDRTKSNA